MFMDAQLDKINSQASFAKKLDQLEMKRILHTARVKSGNGKKLELGLLFNQIRGKFKTDEEALARSAQVRKANYENREAVAQDCTGLKKQLIKISKIWIPGHRETDLISSRHEAEMGSIRKAMI
jgi:hypothetical protein